MVRRHRLLVLARWIGWLAGAALVTVAATGCGNDPAESGAAPTTEATTDPPADIPAEPGESSSPEDDPATEVSSIGLIRRGGLAGDEESWRLRPGDEDTKRAFRLAARRSALEAEVADLVKQPVCCDFYVYYLTVRYADGGALRAVVGEDQGSGVLRDLVSAISNATGAAPGSRVG